MRMRNAPDRQEWHCQTGVQDAACYLHAGCRGAGEHATVGVRNTLKRCVEQSRTVGSRIQADRIGIPEGIGLADHHRRPGEVPAAPSLLSLAANKVFLRSRPRGP